MIECKHGCGYTHEKRNVMNLHESMHCKKIKINRTESVTDVCNHELRLLTSDEKKLVQLNNLDFTKVCIKCEELI